MWDSIAETLLPNYDVFKSLHIIFVVSWFAGLFYIVRLFIYHVEGNQKQELERTILHRQFSIMEWRLWNIITTPAMVLTVVFGILMLLANRSLLELPWMHLKLGFVGVLLVYHFMCQNMMNKLKAGTFSWKSNQLRLWNEGATLLLVAIVFLVELRSSLGWLGGVCGFFGVGIGLMLGIRLYKRLLKNKK